MSVPPVLKLNVNAKNLLRLKGLFNPAANGSYVNDAVLTVKLLQRDRSVISTFTVTMTYVAGSKGDYEGWTVKLDMIAVRGRYRVEMYDADGYLHRMCDAVGYERSVV